MPESLFPPGEGAPKGRMRELPRSAEPKAGAHESGSYRRRPLFYSNPLIVSSNFSLLISPTAKLLAIPFLSMI